MENSSNMHLSINLSDPKAGAMLIAIAGILGSGATVAAPAAKAAPKMEVVADEVPAAAPKVAPKAAPAPKVAPKAAPAPAPAPKAAPTVSIADLDEDGQREAVKTLIGRHSKKGFTAGIKGLLGAYGVAKGSELAAENLVEFHDLLERHVKGESVEDLLAAMGDSEDLT